MTFTTRLGMTALLALFALLAPCRAFALDGSTAGDEPAVLINDNRTPAGVLADGTLTLKLRAQTGRWQPEGPQGPAVRIEAFGEEMKPLQVPAPLLRVPQGTTIVASIRNDLEVSLRVHGLCTRDGSPCVPITVPASESREVRFAASTAGTYHYWATTTGMPLSFRAALDTQLSGAFIVDEPGVASDDDRVLVISDWTSLTTDQLRQLLNADDPGAMFFALKLQFMPLINGLSWPATEHLTYRLGESIRWRVVNLSSQQHPMHLHGFYFDVETLGDGLRETAFDQAHQAHVVTQLLKPGMTMAMRWRAERAGNWLFHCHMALHVAPERRIGPQGATSHAGEAHEHHGGEGTGTTKVVPSMGGGPVPSMAGSPASTSESSAPMSGSPGPSMNESPVPSMSGSSAPSMAGSPVPSTGGDAAPFMHHGAAAGMAGMVMGITIVGPETASAPASLPADVSARKLTLVMQTEAQRYGTAPAYGFALADEMGVAPAAVSVPAPLLTLERGKPVEITLVNRLPEATAIHWHGMELDSYYDGVHGWSGAGERVTPIIEPGDSFIVRLTPPRTGTFMYHTHMHDDHQLSSGMYGALLVLEPGETFDPALDHVVVIGRGGPGPAAPTVINGARDPIFTWKAGARHRVRLVHITADDVAVVSLVTPDGPLKWTPVSKDGAALPPEQRTTRPSVQTIAVGETYDFEYDAPQDRQAFWLEVRTPAGRWQAQGRVTIK